MLSLSPFPLSLLLSFLSHVLATPNPIGPAGQTINLLRRSPGDRSAEAWGVWAKNNRDRLTSKYGDSDTLRRRGSGTNLLTNQNADSSFFGSIAIGTPPIAFNVILDTGSADFWLADSQCKSGCLTVPGFNPSASSTYVNHSEPFKIIYGSGQARGVLGQDKVQMAGFSVDNQVFALCNEVSTGLLVEPVSGLLGLGWADISASRSMPFWQTLVSNGVWDEPVMSFQLTRFVDDPSAEVLEPGGTFTMGFLNQSLYTGDIEYLSLAARPSYWLLPLTSMTVLGASIPLPGGTASLSAIDTGTTLVGGPPTIITQIFSQIPGAQPGTGNLDGYYTYPCSLSVNVSLSFGGRTWTIDPKDFRLAQLNNGPNSRCLGAFFQLETGSSAPSWIIGDTFLKNVYSVFRYNPPSIGFADLSPLAQAVHDGPIPTPTIGSAAQGVTATGRPRRPNGAERLVLSGGALRLLVVALVLLGASLA